MSWREREFRHESEAYYRSLDQMAINATGPIEPVMGGHAEGGRTVTDWFKFPYQGRNVKIEFDYHGADVRVCVEGIEEVFWLPDTDTMPLIARAREMALKLLKEDDERSGRDDTSARADRRHGDSGSDLPAAR